MIVDFDRVAIASIKLELVNDEIAIFDPQIDPIAHREAHACDRLIGKVAAGVVNQIAELGRRDRQIDAGNADTAASIDLNAVIIAVLNQRIDHAADDIEATR